MPSIPSFSGTAGNPYSTPSGWTLYGDTLKYATTTAISNGSFENSHLLANDTLSDTVTITSVINCDISGWGEVGHAVLNSSIDGMRFFFRPDQDLLVAQEYTAGSGGSSYFSGALGLTTGAHTLVTTFNPTTKAFTVSLDSTGVISDTYTGSATGLKAGITLDNAFGNSVYQSFSSIDVSIAGGTPGTIDTLENPIVLGSTGNDITTTGLGTLTTLTIGGVTATAISATGGDGTFSAPDWVEGAVGLYIGSGQTVIAGDGSTTATVTTGNVTAPSGRDFITITSVNTDPAYLGGQTTLTVGDQIKFRTAADLSTTTNYIGADGEIVTTYSGSQTIQRRAYSTGLVTDIILINGVSDTSYTKNVHALYFNRGRARQNSAGIFYKKSPNDAGYLVNKTWFFGASGTNYALTASAGSYTYTGQSSTITKSKVITASAGSYSYSGQSATLKRSKLITASAGSYVYTGVSAAVAKNRVLTASSGSYSYSGLSATLLKTKVIAASAGAYTYSGQSATLLKSKVLEASAGSYAYTGQNATILRSKLISASAGSYVYTGISATITKSASSSYSLIASAGSYSYTGQSATLLKTKVIAASAGSYTYSGQSATLKRSKLITASAGSYAYSGVSASIARGRVLSASAGSYTYTGKSAVISRGRYLSAQSGAYALTGVSVSIKLDRLLVASSGSYIYTGQAATIYRTGASFPDGRHTIYVRPELTEIYVRPESTTIEAN